ncbi:alkaline phosphatase [Bradyrhizobium ottawaense]|uniref:BREX-1 system phosphatase PglZ type A n=1 Tax=Bradyrhizobium ottawaense TaxID=931866 RepID=UPI0012606542|nr:BREX-1 system phosphatase PglZ type A [Bradyrhizobium ottawaense]BBO04475.1 alkaline phosphatase [Bradyrhizobium ottawaense]
MSDFKQVTTALHRVFHEEGQRVVFWNDPDREFLDALPSIAIDGVTPIRLDEVGGLEVKIRLERREPAAKFLLYSPAEEPDFEDDWLLDIRLYSRSFRADRASILLQDLGLVNQHLRTHIADRRKFFDAKDRFQKLKGLIAPDDAGADIDRKMIAVVSRADQPELFNILRTIFHAWSEASTDVDLDEPPAAWASVEKFDLDVPFWQMIRTAFGYFDENPSLKKLLFALFVTDYAYHLNGDIPQAVRGFVLPRVGASNVVVCLAQWRDSNSKGASYDRLSAVAAAILKIEDHLPDLEIDQLAGVMTFLAVEKRIASSLRERVQTTADAINADDIRAVAALRQVGHWASLDGPQSPEAPRKALHDVYDALVAAADFYALRNVHKAGFDYPSATAMYRAYEAELYRFDQLYRHFCEAADGAEKQGWNIVKPLRADIEARYANWYLTSISLAWGKFLEPKDGLLAKWQIDEVPNQYRFYDRQVRPWVEEADSRRAFVIISDAFRYEAAQELTSELNGKYRFGAVLSSQLGVLPSYTALGMASLLPHRTLAYKGADVLVDGNTSAAGDRDGILQRVGGMACRYDDLMAKKKEEGREFVKDKKVVYIYHDAVDAIGDDSKTEGHTFEAVRKAINDLTALVGYIVNSLNGHHILVTADHGFLFTETARPETDKSKLNVKPDDAVLAKKRYLLAPSLPDLDVAWHGRTSTTANVDGDMEFWIPKGTNLFHFVGGARFVHGGAMPQEIVVPVVTVKHMRGKSAQETKTKPVTVQVLGTNHRITSAYCRFQLIQMEAVSERLKQATLRVAVYEGNEAVTDVQTVKFDSASGNLDERKKWVNLVLKDRDYNKKAPYRLVLKDAETGIEQQSVEVIIDRAFTDDF